MVLAEPVVRDSGDGRRPRDVVQQRGYDQIAVIVRGASERCALQGVLELIDRFAVVGKSGHGAAGAQDLLDDCVGGLHRA